MNEAQSSLAHQAGVVTTLLLWTLLALVLLFASPLDSDPPMGGVAKFVAPLRACAVTLTGSVLAPALLLVRFARVRRLWHAAVLAVVAFGLFLLSFQSGAMISAMSWLDEQPFILLSAWRYLALSGFLHAVQVAILLGGYGLIGRRRGGGSAPHEPAPPVSSPAEARAARRGTRAEWRAFSMTLGSLVLLVAGTVVTIREMQLRQIPARVWALLRESRDVEILTLDNGRPRIPGLDENATPGTGEYLQGRAILHRVSVSTPRERALLAACLRRALTGWADTIVPTGPEGNHAIRLTGENTTYSLIVTFQGRLVVYEGDKGLSNAGLFGSPDEREALRSFLESADER